MRKYLFLFFALFSQFYFSQADCSTAISVCGNSDITYTPSGKGSQDEVLGGCLDREHNSAWYVFTIATAGTLTFTIDPTGPVDYDWAIFGPNVNCANKGTPIRCSSNNGVAAGTYLTGMNMTSTDTTEGPGSGDGFVKYLDVNAGETYYLYIDNYSATVYTFHLTWGGTATLVSPFTDPTLQPNPFVPPGNSGVNPADPREISLCGNNFDFSTLSAGILNGNSNFEITYHTSQNDALTGANPVLNPQTVTTGTNYYYSIHYQYADPSNPANACRQIGIFKFKIGDITGNNVELFGCNNNNLNKATFDLTTANVSGDPNATMKYYYTLADLTAGTAQITNPQQFLSEEKVIYVLITTSQGCTITAQIKLSFLPVVIVNEANLRSCALEENPQNASFDLTTATVTSQINTTKKYYTTLSNAVANINEILNPSAYIASNGSVYVKVIDENQCYAIAKLNLNVIPPVYSDVLKDKTICIEDKTVLDAGSGFDAYEWSTGATTQSITNVGVGEYYVKLKKGSCVVKQTIRVIPAPQPVISGINVSNSTITVNVAGGSKPYQYSMDKVNWQDSNVFNGLKRGDHRVYVKDFFNCNPIDISVFVPNLINAITPNNDGINDIIDYSQLAYKRNLEFNIFDRYGNKIFQGNKFNDHKWDGTSSNKKVSTGNYWYVITWNENDSQNTAVKYTGWIMVKN